MLRGRLDLTEGAIGKKLLFFALPLLGSSLVQQLYNTVDLLFVGNWLTKESYAAVGASSLLITCLVGFFTGMSVGSNIVIAQAIGLKARERIQDSVHTAIGLSMAGGLVLTAVGLIGAPHFLRWMHTDRAIIEEAAAYLRIYFLSLVPAITYNMASGIIRAMGNSGVPMVIQLVGGVGNVLADAVFLGLYRNVEAVAWATMLSQTLAACLSLFYLARFGTGCTLYIKKIRIEKKILRDIVRIGIPAGAQNLVITVSNMIAQYHINSLGVNSIGAFTTYFKVELLLYHPIVALGQTMTTFTGQNIGAGKTGRVKKGVRLCITSGIALSALTAALLLLLGRQAFGLFVSDPDVIACGLRIIRVTFPFYWLYVVLEILADTIRGAGLGSPPMAIILANICILRGILLFVFMGVWRDVQAIAAAYPVTWFTAAVCMYLYYRKIDWERWGLLG